MSELFHFANEGDDMVHVFDIMMVPTLKHSLLWVLYTDEAYDTLHY